MTTINPKLPYWHHQLVLSWYHHQPESHQQSFKKVSQLEHRTPGSGKNIENRKIRNTTHVKREIRSHHSTHPASSTLPPLSIPGLPGARLVLKAMVEITVTFTILTINIFIKVLNDINFCLSSSSFELLSLPQSRQSDNSCQFTHQEIFLRTPRH